MVKSPTRLDLSGGTLDIFPLYILQHGCKVINISIDIMTQCQISVAEELTFISKDYNKRSIANQAEDKTFIFHRLISEYFDLWDHSISITTSSQAPIGSGLGGSSSLLISMIKAISLYLDLAMDNQSIMKVAQDIETSVIEVPTGTQDYYPVIYQGINTIHYQIGGPVLEEMKLSQEFVNSLQKRMWLVYTGISHHSAEENWQLFTRFIGKDKMTREIFNQIKNISNQVYDALREENLDRVIQLVGEEWAQRKQLLPTMETDTMVQIKSALDHHPIFIKACGAAAGGSLMIFGPKEIDMELKKITDRLNCSILDFTLLQ